MPRALRIWALAVAVAACSGGGATDVPDDPGNGAGSAEAAVSELLGHLKLGEFGEAVPLAIPGQAVLASLAEGATVEDVANGLRDGDELIVNNFWSGFAQTVEPFLIDTPELAGSEPIETQGVSFDLVTVRSTGGERTFTTRDVEGYRVDIFATFGPSLASRLYPAVERLFDSPEEDAIFVLGALRDQVPSLHMAALTPGLAPNVVQDILQLIELVTRIS